ncbi:hypothetical protein BOTBODRAFT_39836 [Botryobasidium botryosum FD-172 SS1]|uniref:Uncharacterized protein n=1 Tax=Botryobasidium botryosum (strain FD-172 SS1) TaxID=930990 RepID=A0A067M3C8_BOTB1|nr:hypothetical protein BOTBODRAFT_39836 [Botryobasidium botryosum FD-172 SS1]
MDRPTSTVSPAAIYLKPRSSTIGGGVWGEEAANPERHELMQATSEMDGPLSPAPSHPEVDGQPADSAHSLRQDEPDKLLQATDEMDEPLSPTLSSSEDSSWAAGSVADVWYKGDRLMQATGEMDAPVSPGLTSSEGGGGNSSPVDDVRWREADELTQATSEMDEPLSPALSYSDNGGGTGGCVDNVRWDVVGEFELTGAADEVDELLSPALSWPQDDGEAWCLTHDVGWDEKDEPTQAISRSLWACAGGDAVEPVHEVGVQTIRGTVGSAPVGEGSPLGAQDTGGAAAWDVEAVGVEVEVEGSTTRPNERGGDLPAQGLSPGASTAGASWEKTRRRFLSSPQLWLAAWRARMSLLPAEDLDVGVINFFLMGKWFGIPSPKAIYIEQRMAGVWRRTKLDYSGPRFRQYRAHFLCQTSQDKMVATASEVLFLIPGTEPPLVMVVGGRGRDAWVLGPANKVRSYDRWDVWGGSQFYKHVCQLQGWTIPDKVNVQFPDCLQSGAAYGPSLCSLSLRILAEGIKRRLLSRKWEGPCHHVERLSIYRYMAVACAAAYADHCAHPYYGVLSEDEVTAVGTLAQPRRDEAMAALTQQVRVCDACNSRWFEGSDGEEGGSNSSEGDHGDEEYCPEGVPLHGMDLDDLEDCGDRQGRWMPPTPEERNEQRGRLLSVPSRWQRTWNWRLALVWDACFPGTAIDLYLHHVWTHLGSATDVLYVEASVAGAETLSPDVVRRYRKSAFLPPVGPCPKRPVLFLLSQPQAEGGWELGPSFVVAMDVEKARVFAIGLAPTSWPAGAIGWDVWEGPKVWTRVCDLHGWKTGRMNQVVHVALDLGALHQDHDTRMVRIAEHIMEHGLITNGAGNLVTPPAQCDHWKRLRMFLTVQEVCHEAYLVYEHLRASPPEEWPPAADGVDGAHPPTPVAMVKELEGRHWAIAQDDSVFRLHTQVLACPRCKVRRAAAVLDWERVPAEKSGPEGAPDQPQESPPERGVGRLGRHRAMEGPDVDGEQEAAEDTLEAAKAAPRRDPKALATQPESVFRFPRRTLPVALPLPSPPLWPRHDNLFDDYFGCPTSDEFAPTDGRIYLPQPRTPAMSPWAESRDRGVRMLTESLHQFYLQPPMKPVEHVLTVGEAQPYVPSAGQPYALQRGADVPTREVEAQDVVSLSLGEMLEIGGENPVSPTSFQTFVRGRDAHGRLIALDLERDAFDLAREELEVSVDIDSFIWVTYRPEFAGRIQLRLTPTMGHHAPIRKSNNVEVRLLMPPSQEELDLAGGKRPWVAPKVSLASIPHVVLGRIHEGRGPIAMYAFFPRLYRLHTLYNQPVSMVPYEVQKLFWNKVFLPALREHSDAAGAAYGCWTVEEHVAHTATTGELKGNTNKSRGHVVGPETWSAILDTMRSIIADGGLDLQRYGSLFFVVEGKGMKEWTRVSLDEGPCVGERSPWMALRTKFTCLDLGRMLDREHGELLVDIGITISPGVGTTPAVGLWRLPHLEASYGAGGFRSGTVHHANTMLGYGGLQARMALERAQRSHVHARKSYCLAYEATRNVTNVPIYPKDGDAYAGNSTYLQISDALLKQLSGTATRSRLGVRDEYTVGGQVVGVIQEHLSAMVCAHGPTNTPSRLTPLCR